MDTGVVSQDFSARCTTGIDSSPQNGIGAANSGYAELKAQKGNSKNEYPPQGKASKNQYII